MVRLRAPGGCPWDREQTFDTIKPYLLEETYEVMDAIDARDWPELTGELGDLLLQSVFFSQMAAEQNLFSIADALDAINEKLIRRHPHVFGEQTAETAGDVRRIWGEVKAAEKNEKKQKGERGGGLLDSVPRALPALVEAQQLTSRAAHVGFDWDNAEQELGDMLFVLVNLARFVKVDPEQALRKTNAKFRQRFGYIERRLGEQGKSPEEATLAEMDALWEESKR